MTIIVRIRHNASGEAVEHEDRHSADDAVDYYSDGGGACDCNRQINWRRAKGWSEEQIWADDTGFCLGVGQYAVSVLNDGVEIYRDDGVPA